MRVRGMGRGRYHSWWRRSVEGIQGLLYGSGWAARLAYSLGLQGRLHVDHRSLAFGGPGGRASLRVAFVSDLHAGPLTDPRLLEAAVRRLPAAAPALLLLG